MKVEYSGENTLALGISMVIFTGTTQLSERGEIIFFYAALREKTKQTSHSRGSGTIETIPLIGEVQQNII